MARPRQGEPASPAPTPAILGPMPAGLPELAQDLVCVRDGAVLGKGGI